MRISVKNIPFFLVSILLLSSTCDISLAAENLSHITEAGGTVYFAWDGESQSYTADAGTGSFSNLGGNVSGPDGDAAVDCAAGDINTSIYHYTVLSSESAAQSSVEGSNYSLKTPYDGNCNNESTSRDRTVITLSSDQPELYIRWSQKFTGNWMNGSVQHKLTKMAPLAHGGDDRYSTGYFTFRSNSKNMSLQKVINVEGQFDLDGVANRASACVLFSSKHGAGNQYDGVNRYWDNYNNGIGGTDGEFYFTTDTWYTIEIHVKVNSDENTANAVAEMWVDGKKVFGLTNFRFYGPANPEIPGIGFIELQHIYYNRSTNDNQPTYMDNIVVADKYIGPPSGINKLEPPSNLRIESVTQ